MKTGFSNTFGKLRKQIAAGALVALAIALPAVSAAASTVNIEANTSVANATKSGSWAGSTTASHNDVVAVQVVYNNKEDASSNKVANNLRVKISFPTTAGKVQKVSTKTSADNTNTVNGSATVNLSQADAYLQYIPGTATWKHATTANGPMTTTQKVSDDVVLSANGANLGKENPCQAGSIVVQARVMTPGTKVVKEVEKSTESGKYAQSNTAVAGDTLKYRITYQNTGNTQAKNVIVRDNLPPKMTLVPNTTRVYSSVADGALDKSNSLTAGGIDVGNPMPGAVIYVTFEVKVPAASELACGDTVFRNIGIAHPKTESEYYNVAVTTVNKKCETTPKTPAFACSAFEVTKNDAGKSVVVSKYTHTQTNGATFKNVVIDWGDSTDALTTDSVVGKTHTYSAAGTYTITATSHFTANGKDVTAGGCEQTVTFGQVLGTTTPTPTATPPVEELPHTGAAQVFSLFGAAVVVAAVAHRLFLSRRQSR